MFPRLDDVFYLCQELIWVVLVGEFEHQGLVNRIMEIKVHYAFPFCILTGSQLTYASEQEALQRIQLLLEVFACENWDGPEVEFSVNTLFQNDLVRSPRPSWEELMFVSENLKIDCFHLVKWLSIFTVHFNGNENWYCQVLELKLLYNFLHWPFKLLWLSLCIIDMTESKNTVLVMEK